ncbi:hypothetical protein [Tabrizicola sp.]|uniref:hypothetical protein n=1 Tax=Tabrizicola sp. TaxID=2005166 RepID=UPI0027353A65|nr:hypothetical protein [Tabrizicola sp.]MDP3196133.1 hypothetical protein [Tabrizicola sp.]
MSFTRIGEIVARLAFGLGILTVIMGLLLRTDPDPEAARQVYLRGMPIGRFIDTGVYSILVGIVLGILCEISRAVAREQE